MMFFDSVCSSQRQEIMRLDSQNGRSSLPESKTGDTILQPLTSFAGSHEYLQAVTIR